MKNKLFLLTSLLIMASMLITACGGETVEVTRVVKVIEESPNVCTLVLDLHLEAEPGQFVMAWLPGLDERPFSLVRAEPGALEDGLDRSRTQLGRADRGESPLELSDRGPRSGGQDDLGHG